MRALDLAALLWTVVASMYVVGTVTGRISVEPPGPMVTPSDVAQLLAGGGTPLEVFNAIMATLLASLVLAGAASRLLGFMPAQTTIALFGVALGIFLFGRALYYVMNVGSLMATLLEKSVPGIDVPDSVELMLNAVGWLLGFMALADWWRGSGSLRHVG